MSEEKKCGKNWRLVEHLSEHEREELERDFAISLKGAYVVVALTKPQWIALHGSE
jgi:hypothetical protein